MILSKLLCMGDSLTEGYGIQVGLEWPSIVHSELTIEVVNCGISGDTTGGMLGRFSSALKLHQPSHVIIMGGTNDLWMSLPFNLILSNTMAMIRQARHVRAEVMVGIPTSCYITVADDPLDNIFNSGTDFATLVQNYQAYLREAMKLDETPIIDFSIGMTEHMFLSDGVHPNREGHQKMAETAISVLRDYLS